MMLEEIGGYDSYTDKFMKNTTPNRIEVGTDGSIHNLSLSNSHGIYIMTQEELDKFDYIDKSTKLYTKDEVITMLTDLQQDIEENVLADDPDTLQPFLQARETCVAVIQTKIDKLRGEIK